MSALSAARIIPPQFAMAWKWPADAVAATPVALPVDPTRFIADLATSLGALLELPVTAAATNAEGDVVTAMLVRADGLTVAMGIPEMLAGAVVGYRCGGPFVPVCASGSAVARVVTEIETAILSVVSRNWPGRGEWLAAPIDEVTPPFTVRLEAEGHAFALPVAIRLPIIKPIEVDRAVNRTAWASALRSALDATPFAVRAVLHDSMIPLSAAVALRVGGIVPIETRRDVSLRLGDHALARGTIAPDDDGGHRITVAAVGPARVVPAHVISPSIKEQP